MDDESKSNQTMYLFYEMTKGEYVLYVYAIDSVSLSMYLVTKLKRRNHSLRLGYLAHGSKLYALGGEESENKDWEYPREVFVCDLSSNRNINREGEEEEPHEWKEEPKLKSGKPFPMVVAVKGKIYALAGSILFHEGPDTIDSAFEVLDTNSSSRDWSPLPNPPFYSWYSDYPGPTVLSHTVFGDAIYVLVGKHGPNMEIGVPVLFSFDIIENVWKEHPDGFSPDNPIPDCLTNHRGFTSTDVAGCKLFFCEASCSSGVKLYAYDLAIGNKNEMEVEDKDDVTEFVHNDNLIYWDYEPDTECDAGSCWQVPRIKLPVRLLELSEPPRQALVAHLASQMLLVVCAYYPPPGKFKGRFIYTCLLKLAKKEFSTPNADSSWDSAVIVREKYYKISKHFWLIKAWSLM